VNGLLYAKLVDMDSEREEAQKEMSDLRRHLSEMDDDHRVKERSFRVTLEEARQTECQLGDDRRRLEQCLDDAGAELIETRLQLSAAEGRVSALESQLRQVDSSRIDVETKLASVVSSLRRFVGLGGGGAVLRSRSVSPRRAQSTRSPARSRYPVKGLLYTVCSQCLLILINSNSSTTFQLSSVALNFMI